MAGQQGSESLEDQLCRQGSSAERDGMNCIALSRFRDQTLHRHQLAERALEIVSLRSPHRLSMVYPVHVMTRKFLGDMMRKLSVTESRNRGQFALAQRRTEDVRKQGLDRVEKAAQIPLQKMS